MVNASTAANMNAGTFFKFEPPVKGETGLLKEHSIACEWGQTGLCGVLVSSHLRPFLLACADKPGWLARGAHEQRGVAEPVPLDVLADGRCKFVSARIGESREFAYLVFAYERASAGVVLDDGKAPVLDEM